MTDQLAPEVESASPDGAPEAVRRPSWRRRLARRLFWSAVPLVVVPVLVIGGVVGVFAVHGASTVDTSIRSTGQDAYWLGHAWVDGRKDQDDVDALAQQLRGSGIRDLFVHAGPYADDGELDADLRPRAQWLIGALHTALPQVRVQAWLGDVVGGDRMDLSSVTTRNAVLAGVDDVLADGFDGVHLDFEPIENGDLDFLVLLAAVREHTRAQDAQLSVAVPKVEPLSWVEAVMSVVPFHLPRWSPGYLGQVAELVNQVAIMTYDTALPTETAYRGYVRRQTEVALRVVPDNVTLLIGAPAYHEQRINRYDSAETVAGAVSGVQLALAADDESERPAVGLALYVDFTATDQDWSSYQDGWAPLDG